MKTRRYTYHTCTYGCVGVRAVEDGEHGLANHHRGACDERDPAKDLLGDEPVPRGLEALLAAVGASPSARLLDLVLRGTLHAVRAPPPPPTLALA